MRHDITSLRSTIVRQRTERRELRRLERELGSFDTAAGRAELSAILERHTAREVAPIRPILDRVLMQPPVRTR